MLFGKIFTNIETNQLGFKRPNVHPYTLTYKLYPCNEHS